MINQQEVRYIDIESLQLWSENPRDPIYDDNASNEEIIRAALENKQNKWDLNKLNNSMGEYYDFSELPIVVYHNDIPIVYDGNRRVILGMIKNGHYKGVSGINVKTQYPDKIPCNVCEQSIAVSSVFRKHADSGTWKPLERDIFAYKYMKRPKTFIMILEEKIGYFSENPHMNQGFVKDEIFNGQKLKSLGILLDGETIKSKHSQDDTKRILEDLSIKVKNKDINTRASRGDVLGILSPGIRKKIDENGDNQEVEVFVGGQSTTSHEKVNAPKVTKRIKIPKKTIFGGKIYIKAGKLNNLYRDIEELYSFYESKKDSLSDSFTSMIRMSLRLLVETASSDINITKIDKYVEKYFQTAKSNLDQDTKTFLAGQNVTDTSIVQLLHTGAHNYSSSANIEQTIALSIIIGKMLEISHK